MRSSRMRSCVLAACLLALLGAAHALAGEPVEAAEKEVSLRWALGALRTEGAEPSGIKQDTQLEGGARLKFLVEPLSPGSVYLILLDSEGNAQVLYRQASRRLEGAGAEPTYIPPGREWFELDDHKGTETFFLLASTEPLAPLESLLDSLRADGADRKRVSTEIVEEVRRLHKEHRRFARPVEKPVMIGGLTRGAQSASIDHLAVEISAERFYGKTITIDH